MQGLGEEGHERELAAPIGGVLPALYETEVEPGKVNSKQYTWEVNRLVEQEALENALQCNQCRQILLKTDRKFGQFGGTIAAANLSSCRQNETVGYLNHQFSIGLQVLEGNGETGKYGS